MNYVNCALLVVVLVLVVMCCMNKSNEGFGPGLTFRQKKHLNKTCKLASGALVNVGELLAKKGEGEGGYDEISMAVDTLKESGLVKGDFANCARAGKLIKSQWWDGWDVFLPPSF